jgi:rhamnulokinase
MGLWLLNECLRTWERAGSPTELGPLLVAAGEVPDGGPVIDPDDPVLLPPGDMPTRIVEALRRAEQQVPADRPSLVRCIFDSLAAAYARTVDDMRRLSGREIEALHIVGGGAQNALLCRLAARATQLPVLAGPVEATALGNILVQARATGAVDGDLPRLRELVRDTQRITTYGP